MQNRHLVVQYNKAQDITVKADCALFAPCGALETAYYIRDG